MIKTDLKVQTWPIDKLIPYARNPRINDAAVPKLAGLIKEFGFKVPLVIKSDGEIIDGHERFKAAQLLGLKEVPVTIADEWSETQVKAFRLAVNKSAEWAQWDYPLLQCELKELQENDFDLELIDFDLNLENVEFPDNENKEEPDQNDSDGDNEQNLENSSNNEDDTENNTQDNHPEKKPFYTTKIKVPVYEPTGNDIPLTQAFDKTKYDSLIEEIENNTEISEEEKEFLKLAASRHIVFNYKNIAEYYANADKVMQGLMEKSALVIIDYDKAIENGFVKFTKDFQGLLESCKNEA